jgi:hypothetical protein
VFENGGRGAVSEHVNFEGSIQKILIFLNIPTQMLIFLHKYSFGRKIILENFSISQYKYNLCQSHEGIMVLGKKIQVQIIK